MGKHVIDVLALSRAPRDAVWDVLADTSRWTDWGPWVEASLDRQGSFEPEGVGAVRRLVSERKLAGRRVVTLEKVTAFEPPERFDYTMLSGLPLRDYQASVSLTGQGPGSEIHWHVEFDGKIPLTGGLFRRELENVIEDIAERAAAEAERRTGGVRPLEGG